MTGVDERGSGSYDGLGWVRDRDRRRPDLNLERSTVRADMLDRAESMEPFLFQNRTTLAWVAYYSLDGMWSRS